MNIWELHPAIVHFPIALLLSAVALDVVAWWRSQENLGRVATSLLIAGVATGWLAANFGLLAFYTVPAHTHEAHGLMVWHIGFAVTALLLFTGIALVRWLRRNTQPPFSSSSRVLAILAAGTLTITGYLGGAIVYHGGAGVDPELLIAEVRETHSHQQASGDQHNGHSGKSARSYHAPDQDADEHSTNDKAEMPVDKQHEAHESNKKNRAADSEKREGHVTKPERRQAQHDETQEDANSHKHQPDDRKADSTEGTDKKTHDHKAESKDHEASDGQATHEHNKQKSDATTGHADHGKPKNVEPVEKDHKSNNTQRSQQRRDPPLGPDFERNVLENRKSNMPENKSHGTMSHEHDINEMSGDRD